MRKLIYLWVVAIATLSACSGNNNVANNEAEAVADSSSVFNSIADLWVYLDAHEFVSTDGDSIVVTFVGHKAFLNGSPMTADLEVADIQSSAATLTGLSLIAPHHARLVINKRADSLKGVMIDMSDMSRVLNFEEK